MRTVPARLARLRNPAARLFHPGSPEFSTAGLLANAAGIASAAWASANDPILMPFRLSEAVVVSSFWWRNGSAAGGNNDIGIYNAGTLARLVSTGSTASVTNNAWQSTDVTDIAIPSGSYYLVMSVDNITASRVVLTGLANAFSLELAGVLESSTDAFPLPDPITDLVAASTFTRVPVCGFKATVFPW